MSILGDRIKELRLKRGITQSKLAEILNMGRSNVGHIERGRTMPTSETLEKISLFLNTSTDYLLGITDNPDIGYNPFVNYYFMDDEELIKILLKEFPQPIAEQMKDARNLDDMVDTLNQLLIERNLNDLVITDQDRMKRADTIDLIKSMALAFKIAYFKPSNVINKTYSSDHKPKAIPLVGNIRAGDGLLASQNVEDYIYYPFPDGSQPDFAIRASDDLMFDNGIEMGDIIFLRKSDWYEFNGQIVFVHLHESDIFELCRIRTLENSTKYLLHSDNADILDDVPTTAKMLIPGKDFSIIAVYLGTFKTELTSTKPRRYDFRN
ncbi:helix-turn-helix domain-containing protein [Paenibacillus massiliensis]|uniref:helix-turn-helix domain-containing protein n=1 Tax=Paenibacillus massiliensis TaxID=225917 RepID=UPI000471BBF2|nr:helix-turn-helix domain-containing protein [Paenibacillus massiliensis]